MVNIMVEVLDILGTATKEMKQSRASEFVHHLRSLEGHVCVEKFLKKIAGITKLDDGMKNLDKITNEIPYLQVCYVRPGCLEMNAHC